MLLVAFVLILLLVFAYKIRKQQMTICERLGIPGPKANLIFGNAIDIAKHGTSQLFPSWTKKYGPIVGFYIGGRPQVLITDLDLIRRVTIKDFHLFANRHNVVPGGIHPQMQLRKAIVWSQKNIWKQLRSRMSPSFSISKLNRMEDVMMHSIENMMKEIDDESKWGVEVNLKSILEELSFSISTTCFMGLKLSLHDSTCESILKAVKPQLEKSVLAMSMLLFPSLIFIAYPLRVLWETIRLKMLWSPEGVCFNIVKKVVKIREDAKIRKVDVLQLLLDSERVSSTSSAEMSSDDVIDNGTGKSKQLLSEEVIVSNSFDLLLASFETTSVTLQFLVSNMVNNQDVQDKLRNELKTQIELNNGVANFQTFTKVPLLMNIIKETLRQFPPAAPATSRIAEEQYACSEGVQIPKGAGVFIGVSSIHNDPQLWFEPEKFKPERFDNEYNKLAFLPFGVGPRNCIGMQFALMEMQLALAKLVLRYKFEPGPSTEKVIETFETAVTLSPKNGVYCKVVKIEQ